MMRITLLLLGFLALTLPARARTGQAVWQWSVPVGNGRAYLWIPEDCSRVRAVLLAQHNMIERGILEHPVMRRNLAEVGIAEVFIVPGIDPVFRFDEGAGERFDAILRALAAESGYDELTTAPVAPMGHSAHASFPWNFAAWNPGRTLAALSLKGDAPLTNLTGSGRPNPDWGERTLDGVPGLFVMSEQEWWEDRLTPLLRYRAAHPDAPIAVLADVGHGHFDATDELVEFLAMFIRKAAKARWAGPVFDRSAQTPEGRSETGPALKHIKPVQGWLIDRWRGDETPRAAPAPHADYSGASAAAFWCFDEEMARATEVFHAKSHGKRPQQVGFIQAGVLCSIANSHAGTDLEFRPEADGLTFRLGGGFIAPLPPNPPVATKDRRPPVVTVVPKPAEPGNHAHGTVVTSVIIGPVVSAGPGVFRLELDRMYAADDPRTHEAWFLARHQGDALFKGTVRQARLRLPRWTEGSQQRITFPAIPDQPKGTRSLALAATSDAGQSVGYYVREGPAFVENGVLHFTPLPPRSRLPVRITVVAWQFGCGTDSKLQAAPSVEQSFRFGAP